MPNVPFRPGKGKLSHHEGDLQTFNFIRELPKQPCKFKAGDKVRVLGNPEVEEVTKTEWDTISESWIIWLGPYAQREGELVSQDN